MLLGYFGEQFVPPTGPQCGPGCGGCDNCLAPRDSFDGTVATQKLLSCVYRIRQRSGFAVGLNHVVAVLTGAETAKIRQWQHHTLSTYGIGGEHSRNEWGAIARELMRLGLLAQSTGEFPTVDVTPEGFAALKDRRRILLTRPRAETRPRVERAGEIGCDEVLFEKLRRLRKELADTRGVPPYIVFGDTSLRLMARKYPVDASEFRRISGVGAKKLEEYGEAFLEEINAHLRANPRQIFADESLVDSR
jgi:ATP-dependent DNA helicase RecQ